MKKLILTAMTAAAIGQWTTPENVNAVENWPQWRGPTGNGTAPGSKPPVRWDENTNIEWKTAIPGEGHSSPVIWGDKIFLMTAVSQPVPASEQPDAGGSDEPRSDRGPGRRGSGGPRGGFGGGAPDIVLTFQTMCLDRDSGAVLWTRKGQTSKPNEGKHRTNSFCSGSPVTDGGVVISNFSSYGIFCYDMDGKLLWEKDLGDMRTRNGFGEGSSPALHGDTLFILWDTEEDSWLYALDRLTGDEKWKVAREEKTGWTTPYVVTHNGVTQVVVNASNKVRSYDAASGRLVWECGGQTTNAIPSVVSDGETVYAMSGYRGNTAMAIELGASGDLDGSDHIRWQLNRGTPYVPSPLLFNGLLFFCKGNDAFFTCADARTGEVYFSEERLPEISGVYASPVEAGGRIYLCGQNGVTVVMDAGKKLELITANKLDEPINASPAVSGNRLYIRGSNHLYCISE